MNHLEIIESLSKTSVFNGNHAERLIKLLNSQNERFSKTKCHHDLRKSIANTIHFADAQQELIS